MGRADQVNLTLSNPRSSLQNDDMGAQDASMGRLDNASQPLTSRSTSDTWLKMVKEGSPEASVH